MNTFTPTNDSNYDPVAAFADPVAYLASQGIESELVSPEPEGLPVAA